MKLLLTIKVLSREMFLPVIGTLFEGNSLQGRSSKKLPL